MRGKVNIKDNKTRDDRITPAYAGKRDLLREGGFEAEDHPRVCGEKKARSQQPQQPTGSPPRMRGKGVPTL